MESPKIPANKPLDVAPTEASLPVVSVGNVCSVVYDFMDTASFDEEARFEVIEKHGKVFQPGSLIPEKDLDIRLHNPHGLYGATGGTLADILVLDPNDHSVTDIYRLDKRPGEITLFKKSDTENSETDEYQAVTDGSEIAQVYDLLMRFRDVA